MADSFADLWNSSVPTKPSLPLQKLGTPNQQPAHRPKQDVFSMLSSTGSSASNSRSISPAIPAQRASPKPPVASNGNGDPFGSLLPGTLASNNSAKLTIAEKAAQAERDKLANVHRQTHAVKKEMAAWDGLDSLGVLKPTISEPRVADDDDWGFGSNVTTKATSVKTQQEHDDWGLHEFSSQPSKSSSSKPTSISSSPAPPQAPNLWDLDDLSSLPHASTSTVRPAPTSHVQRSDSPGTDFDFGNREDRGGLLDDGSNDEDDILGVLSKPVDAIPKHVPSVNTSARASPVPSAPRSRAPSPPPHIVGQIVEMGFSPQQARVALAATDTGLDVQAALETLLSNDASSSSEMPTRDRVEPEREPEGRKRPPFSRTASGNPRPNHTRDTPSPANSSSQQQQLQDQADKLLAQASEIGLSVFNKANAFWNVGKEKALKVYEERAKAAGSGTSTSSGNSRPKWMQDMPGEDSSDEDEAELGGRKDDEALASKPSRRQPRPKPKPPSQQTKPRTADLFSDEAPKAYVSPFRRGRPQQTTASAPPPKAPSPVPLIQRKTVPASPGAIASSDQHKAVGTEKYKLGQYSEAENAYSKAIAVLPENHLLLVPLYNNRALTRLKTGDYSGAIEDTTFTLTLIGTSYHPAREVKVTGDMEGASVDLADGLVKAWRRRAEAWEGKEKWEEAGKDWECVAGCTWTAGNVRSDGVRGAGRCRRMISVNVGGPEITKPSPKRPVPPRPAVRRGPTPPSQALNKLREVNNALEMEDQARHDLKDTVDARLLAWKGGKETNVRALIASLDTVLWPELGWVKVGMGELVSPGQVKVRYTKAIAKVHPDKLNAGNTTLEQRMVANGVFAALNEAWTAFKQ